MKKTSQTQDEFESVFGKSNQNHCALNAFVYFSLNFKSRRLHQKSIGTSWIDWIKYERIYLKEISIFIWINKSPQYDKIICMFIYFEK